MMNPQTLTILLSIFGCLLGSVLFAKVVPRVALGIDIEEISEDGNPGTSNVMKYCGVRLGILTGILEFGKGFLPVALGLALLPMGDRTPLFGLIIIAPVMGHMFSVFNYGNGGLGVAPVCGTLICVFLECRLALFLVGLYIVGKFVLHFKHQHRRTIAVFGSFLVCVALFAADPIYRRTYILISAIICVKCLYTELHSENVEPLVEPESPEMKGNVLN